MQRTFILCLAAFVEVGAGCNQSPVPSDKPDLQMSEPLGPPPVLTLLAPKAGLAGRTLTLSLAGEGTHFDKASKVSFSDPGITVNAVRVQNRAAIEIDVRIAPSVPLALHDVQVSTALANGGNEEVRLPKAFSVEASLAAGESGKGKTVPQGGLFDLDLKNLDGAHPISDDTRLVSGARTLYHNVLGARLFGTGLADAKASSLSLVVEGIHKGEKLEYVVDPKDPRLPSVTPRMPVGLVANQQTTGETFAAARATNLYKFQTTQDNQVMLLSAVPSVVWAGRTLVGALAPASGKFADGQFLYASTPSAGQTAHVLLGLLKDKGEHFVTLLPTSQTGGPGHEYAVTLRTLPAKSQSLKEDAMKADSPMAPLATWDLADQAVVATDGAFDTRTDTDYIKLNVQKSGRLYVQLTTKGLHLGRATTAVVILGSDCMMPMAAARTTQQDAQVAAGMSYCVQLLGLAGTTEPYQVVFAIE